MKYLLPLGLLSATLFLTGCETVVVEHHHAVHDGYYGGYYGPHHHDTVVVVDGPGYHRPAPYYAAARVEYHTDKHGKFYWRNGHKVYVQRW